jgi:hypothetical protein
MVESVGAVMARLVDFWVYGGSLAALALIIVALGFAYYLPLTLLLVFLLLPAYMLHQAEEHVDDRFRRFIDEEIGKGRPVLTRRDIFFVNVPGIWGIFALCFTLAVIIHIGFGLIPAYAALVNVPAHLGPGIRMRRYNPGLITAVLLLFPLSLWTIWSIGSLPELSWHWHAIALAVAFISHGTIFGIAAIRVRPHSHADGPSRP